MLFNLLIGFLCIISGIVLIYFYETKIKDDNSKGSYDFKIRTGGIGLIIVGTALILREFEICC